MCWTQSSHLGVRGVRPCRDDEFSNFLRGGVPVLAADYSESPAMPLTAGTRTSAALEDAIGIKPSTGHVIQHERSSRALLRTACTVGRCRVLAPEGGATPRVS